MYLCATLSFSTRLKFGSVFHASSIEETVNVVIFKHVGAVPARACRGAQAASDQAHQDRQPDCRPHRNASSKSVIQALEKKLQDSIENIRAVHEEIKLDESKCPDFDEQASDRWLRKIETFTSCHCDQAEEYLAKDDRSDSSEDEFGDVKEDIQEENSRLEEAEKNLALLKLQMEKYGGIIESIQGASKTKAKIGDLQGLIRFQEELRGCVATRQLSGFQTELE